MRELDRHLNFKILTAVSDGDVRAAWAEKISLKRVLDQLPEELYEAIARNMLAERRPARRNAA
jgi:hypothetical protein